MSDWTDPKPKREQRREKAELVSRWAAYGLFMTAGMLLQTNWDYSENMIVYHILALAAIAFASEFCRLKVWGEKA